MSRNKASMQHDKHMEHLDETPLGKLQQQYWTTKQQVIKKLGKKEDEYVVMSDAELDAKLDLFEAIEQSSTDLLRVIDVYQDKLIQLSIEESEMSQFLKSQSTYDTKTKAGKMMAAVAKAQHLASQQRAGLRVPLVRLFNEVETFRDRAVVDTYLTVRKMENARTEYRGALLWMRNISLELDPDTSKKLAKFRRVQAQVKKTKGRFDRLKSDVLQKIDLLAASRCNMFSHVLVTYQRQLIVFWEKTARTMNAVSEAYKGQQYYEFNIIKDLSDPNKRTRAVKGDEQSDLPASSSPAAATAAAEEPSRQLDDDLINMADAGGAKSSADANTLINFEEGEAAAAAESERQQREDEVNQLIDLMALSEETQLSEQLRELEQLESEKKQKQQKHGNSSSSVASHLKQQQQQSATNSDNSNNSSSLSALLGLNAFMSSASVPQQQQQQQQQQQGERSSSGQLIEVESSSTVAAIPNSANMRLFNDLLSNADEEFEREWASAFSASSSSKPNVTSQQQHHHQQPPQQQDDADEFGFFMSASSADVNRSSSSNNDSFALTGLLSKVAEMAKMPSSHQIADKPTSSQQPSNNNAKNLAAWYDLFAELDPLKNPDSIGTHNAQEEEERNC